MKSETQMKVANTINAEQMFLKIPSELFCVCGSNACGSIMELVKLIKLKQWSEA